MKTGVKQLGPQMLRDKPKISMNNSRTEPKPPTAGNKLKGSDNGDSDGYSDGGFEDDKGDDGQQEDQLEKLRKAMERENARAKKHNENKPQLIQQTSQNNASSMLGPKVGP